MNSRDANDANDADWRWTLIVASVLPKLVGQRVKRREDPRLIQGRGTDGDDVEIAGMQSDHDNYFGRRIASPDLLLGEHRCLRILATKGGHDVDDQSGSAAGVGDGGGRAVSAGHCDREGVDLG